MKYSESYPLYNNDANCSVLVRGSKVPSIDSSERMNFRDIGSTKADANGSFNISLAIPDDAEVGDYMLWVMGTVGVRRETSITASICGEGATIFGITAEVPRAVSPEPGADRAASPPTSAESGSRREPRLYDLTQLPPGVTDYRLPSKEEIPSYYNQYEREWLAGHPNSAIAILTAIIRADPNNLNVRDTRARAAVSVKMWDLAFSDQTHLIIYYTNINKSTAASYYRRRADSGRGLGRDDLALQDETWAKDPPPVPVTVTAGN
jgi:hypothetical protein